MTCGRAYATGMDKSNQERSRVMSCVPPSPMPLPSFVTLTLNPAVDLACTAAAVRPLHKIRTHGDAFDPGGGGINVARVLAELGTPALSLVACGGAIGNLLCDLLARDQLPFEAIPIAGSTRLAITVHEEGSHDEYRFVPEGPHLHEHEWRAAYDRVLAHLDQHKADWLILSGSLPRGVPDDFYARLAKAATARNTQVALDTSGAPLRAAMGTGLALIKPSQGEFEALVGQKLTTREAQDDATKALVDSGAVKAVAVTFGHEGALLTTNAGIWRAPPLNVPAVSAVGAGDSFLAAMVFAFARGDSPEAALNLASCAGAAAVMNPGTAHPKRAQILALFADSHN